ncbi:MAG: HAD-IC family P-type ATPase, partial [Candidatus Firestonebacteria bacterium]|nr:HAD-IC family P-type ATPase [Candidatus Firestonebacteria bacterium]
MAELPWHAQTTVQILKAWGVAERSGLTAREAQLRLAKYGPNRLTQEKKISPFKIFLRQFQNLLTVVLLTACVLSLLVGEYVDAGIISLIVLFVSILGFAQEYRAEKALDALKKMITPSITVLREGREEEVPSQSLVPGDILVLEAGDRIPADARLLESHAMKCDEAALTGESFPAEKNAEPLPAGTALADQANMLFAGTSLAY